MQLDERAVSAKKKEFGVLLTTNHAEKSRHDEGLSRAKHDHADKRFKPHMHNHSQLINVTTHCKFLVQATMAETHRVWVGNMAFGASRAMISTALALLRVQPSEIVWLRRGQSSSSLDCAAILVFSSQDEGARAIAGLDGVQAPFASAASGGRLVARWAQQRPNAGAAAAKAAVVRPSSARRPSTSLPSARPLASHGPSTPTTAPTIIPLAIWAADLLAHHAHIANHALRCCNGTRAIHKL